METGDDIYRERRKGQVSITVEEGIVVMVGLRLNLYKIENFYIAIFFFKIKFKIASNLIFLLF